MKDKDQCGRPAVGHLIWPGRGPIPLCEFHKTPPIRLARMMGWTAQFIPDAPDGTVCESHDPHPDDKWRKEYDRERNMG
jgi:hypothetical protein